jgi:outer membrane protein
MNEKPAITFGAEKPGTARTRGIGMRICLYFVILTLLASLPLGAQEEAPDQGRTTAPSAAQWSLGLAVISSPRPYVGADNSVMPIPIIGLAYKKVYIQGIQAGYHFIDNEKFTFDARAGVVFAGLDPDDSPYLEGMEKRESSIEGGFVFDWKPGKFTLSASAYSDLLGQSDGQQAALDLSHAWRFNRAR